jgi:hypothetical protein
MIGVEVKMKNMKFERDWMLYLHFLENLILVLQLCGRREKKTTKAVNTCNIM